MTLGKSFQSGPEPVGLYFALSQDPTPVADYRDPVGELTLQHVVLIDVVLRHSQPAGARKLDQQRSGRLAERAVAPGEKLQAISLQ
jgi:hypothetical protein